MKLIFFGLFAFLTLFTWHNSIEAVPIVQANLLKKGATFHRGQKVTFLVHVFNPDNKYYQASESRIWAEITDAQNNILKRIDKIEPDHTLSPGTMNTFRMYAGLPGSYNSDLYFRVFFKNKRTFSSLAKKIKISDKLNKNVELLSAKPTIFSKSLGLRGKVEIILQNRGPSYKTGHITTWLEFFHAGNKISKTIKVLNNKPLLAGGQVSFKVPFSLPVTETAKLKYKVSLQSRDSEKSHTLALLPFKSNTSILSNEVNKALSLLKDYEIPLTKEKTKVKKNHLYSDGLEIIEQENLLSKADKALVKKPAVVEPEKKKVNVPPGFLAIDTPDEKIVVYQVKNGDSLRSISKKFFGTEGKFAYIAELNFISDKKTIKVGDELIVEVFTHNQFARVKNKPSSKKEKNKKRNSRKKVTTYQVKKGETLTQIAEKLYGNFMDYKKLLQANGIKKPGKIRPGMVLKVPN
ncbi:LysM peptidoglycan-binding domain-containing protein [Candidatus Riflebacteria bacterium]